MIYINNRINYQTPCTWKSDVWLKSNSSVHIHYTKRGEGRMVGTFEREESILCVHVWSRSWLCDVLIILKQNPVGCTLCKNHWRERIDTEEKLFQWNRLDRSTRFKTKLKGWGWKRISDILCPQFHFNDKTSFKSCHFPIHISIHLGTITIFHIIMDSRLFSHKYMFVCIYYFHYQV